MKVAVYRDILSDRITKYLITDGQDLGCDTIGLLFLGYEEMNLEQPKKYRWFCHKDKFGDDTLYLEWRGEENGGMFNVSKNGVERSASGYGIKSALELVRRGDWVEKFECPPLPKKITTKEVELPSKNKMRVGVYGEALFFVPANAKNLKCTYDIEE